jgi:hypothetical protein
MSEGVKLRKEGVNFRKYVYLGFLMGALAAFASHAGILS